MATVMCLEFLKMILSSNSNNSNSKSLEPPNILVLLKTYVHSFGLEEMLIIPMEDILEDFFVECFFSKGHVVYVAFSFVCLFKLIILIRR